MTQAGVILGTAAYMSPEQARGKPVDKRADIWAFGCVLYEVLTGRRVFAAGEVSDTLAFILTKDPDWTALPASTPASIRRLLRRCLQKDRTRRLADISDARLEIDEATTASGSDEASTADLRLVLSRQRALPWALAAVASIVAAVAILFWAPWRIVPTPVTQRLTVEVGADVSLMTDPATAVVLTRNGEMLAFAAQESASGTSHLYLRRLNELQAARLSGTDGAFGPFFSPDGQWIAFFAGGKLKKVPVSGGAAVTLADAPNGRGGDWGDDGTIVFEPDIAAGTSLLSVSSAGGKTQPLTKLSDGEVTQRWPQVLPGGKAVLYTGHNDGRGFDEANLVVQPLPDGAPRILRRGGYHARYLPSGHVVYVNNGTLLAAPFDLNRLELVGEPVPVLEDVAATTRSGGAQFALSDSGTLVYVRQQGADDQIALHWMDREGKTTPMRVTPARWNSPQFSPDGSRLALDILDERGQNDIWVYDWARDSLSRLTFDVSIERRPVWTEDARRITFSSGRPGNNALYWQRADGSGQVQRLTEGKNAQIAGSWHPSGKILAFHETDVETRIDLMLLPIEGDEVSGWKPGKPTVFLQTPTSESQPAFSPDGRWLAYASDESGRNEVYVRPFPGPGGKWQVSIDGGTEPAWSRTRRELFYRIAGGIVVTGYSVEGDSFRVDKSRPVGLSRNMPRPPTFSLHPDGDRLAVGAVPSTATAQNKVVFVFNFFDELRRIAPTP